MNFKMIIKVLLAPWHLFKFRKGGILPNSAPITNRMK